MIAANISSIPIGIDCDGKQTIFEPNRSNILPDKALPDVLAIPELVAYPLTSVVNREIHLKNIEKTKEIRKVRIPLKRKVHTGYNEDYILNRGQLRRNLYK